MEYKWRGGLLFCLTPTSSQLLFLLFITELPCPSSPPLHPLTIQVSCSPSPRPLLTLPPLSTPYYLLNLEVSCPFLCKPPFILQVSSSAPLPTPETPSFNLPPLPPTCLSPLHLYLLLSFLLFLHLFFISQSLYPSPPPYLLHLHLLLFFSPFLLYLDLIIL